MKNSSKIVLATLLLSSVAFFQPSIALTKEELQGQWKEFKGDVQEKWGKLTDNDMDQIKGNYNQLVGFVQKKYGLTKQKASQQVDAFLTSLKSKMSGASESTDDFKENAKEMGSQMKEDSHNMASDIKKGAQKAWQKTKDVVHNVSDKVSHKTE